MIKFVHFILFLTGLAGVICIGWLLNVVEPGTGIAFWLILTLFLVIFFRKYPKEEIAVFFGFYFGSVAKLSKKLSSHFPQFNYAANE